MRHQSIYSNRAKIGLITPPTNTVNEAEWTRMMPTGVTFHTHRMPLHAPAHTPEEVAAFQHDLDANVRLLAQARVDVIAYACTAGSMVTPASSMPESIKARTGVETVTTAAAIVQSLARLGAARVSVITPYNKAPNDHEAEFLRAHGLEPLAIEGLGLGANGAADIPKISQTPLADIRMLAERTFVQGSDALLITCTDFPSLPLIAELEETFGVPVVSSNTATLYACLRKVGINDHLKNSGVLMTL